jgi:hypothetical protein
MTLQILLLSVAMAIAIGILHRPFRLLWAFLKMIGQMLCILPCLFRCQDAANECQE